jgi:hypothetical protein
MHDSMQNNPAGQDAKWLNISVWTLGALSLAFSLWVTTVGWHNSIFDFHGFRQAQTAISAESMRNGGPILRYETPIFGPPWSLPFEFPLYQALVAFLAKLFGAPIDQTGRFVSEIFHYLTFFPLAAVLARLGLTRLQRVPALALFAASPFYAFMSHLFMIESTALFLSVMYVDQILRLVQAPEGDRRRLWYITGATSFGMLAGLVKVTTLAPFLILAGCMLLWRYWGEYKQGRLKPGPALAVGAVCLGLPAVVTGLWTRFADAVKSRNPFGIGLTSHALKQWNFGTLAQRIHPSNYFRFAYAVNTMVGSRWLALIVLIVACFLCRRSLRAALISFALYLVTIEIFFNLHYVHTYYAYANAIFVVVAIGIVLGAMVGLPGRKAWVGVVLLAAMLATCGIRYMDEYYDLQHTNALSHWQTAALIDRTTTPNDVILIIGLLGSAEFPYQSHRRAVMAPGIPATSSALEQAIRNEGANGIAAIVVCDKGRRDTGLPGLLGELGMPASTAIHTEDCDVYEHVGTQTDGKTSTTE